MADPLKEGSLYVDYAFNFGKYRNQNEEIDSNNYRVKLNALINIMHMQPGTIQDCPYMGIDTSDIQFAENSEIDVALTKLKNLIYQQSERYIGKGFLDTVEVALEDVPGELGTKEVTFKILLTGDVGVMIKSLTTPSGLRFRKLEPLNTTAFV